MKVEKTVMTVDRNKSRSRSKYDEIKNLDVSVEVSSGVYEGETAVISDVDDVIRARIQNLLCRLNKTEMEFIATNSDDRTKIYIQRIK